MIHIKEITDANQKSEITENILRKLPEWFGIEEALFDYIKSVKSRRFFLATTEDNAVGFIAIDYHNSSTAEVFLIGVDPLYHRQGVGKALAKSVSDELKIQGYKLLMVKTLGDSFPDPNYAKTKEFYNSMGFFPLQEIKEIWGASCPCLIMVKVL